VSAAGILVIGAGPAGLAVSLRRPADCRILERGTEAGGLSRSIEFGGGMFDIGGHCFHTPHARVAELVAELMADRWQTQPRDARVWFQGGLIPYPFQRHYERIPDARVVAECRAGLPQAPPSGPAADFEDWLLRRFGPGLARHFLLPYNRKLWGGDLRRMDCGWVESRVAQSGPAADGVRRPLDSDSRVGYPAAGGFGEICRAMARRCGPIEFGQEVVHIDPAARIARTADGRAWPWQRLVSTLPLPRLLALVEGTPAELLQEAARLEYLSLKLMLVLVGTPVPEQAPHRVYVADAAAPPHKLAFNHTSSAELRRRPVHALMCEISHPPGRPAAGDAALTRLSLDWLVDSGLLRSHAEVVETRMVDVPYAYPVPTHGRAAIVARLQAWLAAQGIHSIGRFGAWEYANSDDCIRQGLELADRLDPAQPAFGVGSA
jgi:protoporphyrinogen oxidase